MKRIKAFLRQWNELITLPIAMLLWWLSDDIIRWFDPTAASYDGGIFQIILFAIICLFVANGVVWIIIKLTFPGIYDYLDNFLEQNLKNSSNPNYTMSLWQKSVIVLWVFSLYFLSLVALLRIL